MPVDLTPEQLDMLLALVRQKRNLLRRELDTYGETPLGARVLSDLDALELKLVGA